MSIKPLDKRTLDAGARACAQLVRAVSSATAAPFRKAAAGSALARLHELLVKEKYIIIAALESFVDARATVSALVEVYSVSLREVAAPTPTPGPSAQLRENNDIPGAEAPKPHAAESGQQLPSGGRDSRGTASSSGTTDGGAAAGHGAGPFPEDWVPLLVDSSAVVAGCMQLGVFTFNPTPVGSDLDADLQRRVRQVYACGTAMSSALLLSDAMPALSRLLSAEAQRGPARALLTPRQMATCLQPLGELLTAAYKLYNVPLPVSPQRVRQPHPPAPNSPAAATTIATDTTPAPSPTPTPGTSTRPAAGPSAATPAADGSGQTQTRSSTPHATASEPGGSAAVPVPHGRDDPTTSSSSPTQPTQQTPQHLGAAILIAAAESGVVEAACRAAVGALEQGGGGGQQQQQQGSACVTGRDREQLVRQLLELPRQLVESSPLATAEMLPKEPVRTMFKGPCVQVRGARSTDDAGLTSCSACKLKHYTRTRFFLHVSRFNRKRHGGVSVAANGTSRPGLYRCLFSLICLHAVPLRAAYPSPQYVLAVHSVSQLHAVDGGTTYGLPYDSLMPPMREEGKAELLCTGAEDAMYWWMRTCVCGGLQLSPRGLFELCLRTAGVAADCWRRRNGLPAATEAAGVSAGDSGSGSSSWTGKAASSGRQHEQGKAALGDNEADTARQAGLCRTGGAGSAASGGSGSPAAADPPGATLDSSQCPRLAIQALKCSLALMESSCRATAEVGAGEAEWGPWGRGARVSKGTGSGAGGGVRADCVPSPSGNTAVGEGDREAGGGGLDGQGACGGGSGDGMQEAAAHDEAGGSASVGLSDGGRAGQGGIADTGSGSGGRSSAAEETCGRGGKGSGAWLGDGGPLARRWWRAAVAAVHCGMDEVEAVGSRVAFSCVDKVLDLSLAMPETDPGEGPNT